MNKLSELDSLIMEVLNDEPELLNEKLPFDREDFEKIFGKKLEKIQGLASGAPTKVSAQTAWELSQVGPDKNVLGLNDIEWFQNNAASERFDVKVQANLVAIQQKYRSLTGQDPTKAILRMLT